jgi:uncharacterized protein GlcG (DUF336 family)
MISTLFLAACRADGQKVTVTVVDAAGIARIARDLEAK